MRKLLIILILLSGCTHLPLQKGEDISFQVPIYTWKDEYILQAKGDWCPWKPGVVQCDAKLAGDYVMKAGQWEPLKLVKRKELVDGIQSYSEESQIVPYDPKDDDCINRAPNGFFCSPNFVIKVTPQQSAPADLWGYHRVAYDRLIKRGITGKGAEIGVIDSGVNHHVDLINVNWSKAYNAINGSSDVSDNGTQHGTHCSGTIISKGAVTRTKGGCPECSIIPIKFLSDNGSGSLFNAIKAIDYGTSLKLPILSNSWGGGGYSSPLRQSIKRYCETNGLFIAAAGNEGNNTDVTAAYPASYDENCIISVAAISQDGRLGSFSNYGKGITIAAPGVGIRSTVGTEGEATWNGTSMATPHVSALAGLLYSKFGKEGLKRRIQRRGIKNEFLKGKTHKAKEAISRKKE